MQGVDIDNVLIGKAVRNLSDVRHQLAQHMEATPAAECSQPAYWQAQKRAKSLSKVGSRQAAGWGC
jgi:hypothetical protein